ncbi:serine/threonine-protein kinase [Nocardia barduliensis]|uniref:serine/threonine-protein kinase n=1 Tax=Nocardia barduliensis TaxID=2736643 RepID=UPI0015717BE1|nr:serine/threonine-protein kinase [Nocardia barduliensis]
MLREQESFAGYLIEGVLGQGGMGTVYLARHPRLPRLVALKLLNRAVSEDEELRRRFELEANVVARLEHPGIVGVYDRGTQDGHLWISMQYIRGTDAARLDPRTTRPEHVLRIVTDTAHALDYAHSRGVLHRDIKPANILIAEPEAGREARAVLTDFGIARLLDADTKLTATGTFTATLAYAAPEQLSGEPVDHRADQYSLGCTLFTLLAGQPPFPSTNPGQIVAGHLAKPVPRLSDTRPELPRPLDDVIARAMAKHRDERFASCGDFAAAATAALRGEAPFVRSAPTGTVGQQRPGHAVAAVDPWPRSAPTWLNRPPDPVRHAMPAPAAQPATPVDDPRRPSGAVARTAAVVSFAFGLLSAVIVIQGVRELAARRGTGRPMRDLLLDILVPMSISSAASLLLVGGAVALFARKRAGRVAVALGTGIITLLALIAIGASLGGDSRRDTVFFGTILLFAFTGLSCALAPATGRWLARRSP